MATVFDPRGNRLDARTEPLPPNHPIVVLCYIGAGLVLICLYVLFGPRCCRRTQDSGDSAEARREELIRRMAWVQYGGSDIERRAEGHAEPARPASARLARAWRFVSRARNRAPDKPEGVDEVEQRGLEVTRTVTNQYGVPDKPV